MKQVKDVVNAKAAPAEEVEADETQEVVSEAETTEEEVVSEEEVVDEVVAEAEETEEELVEEEGIDIEADVQALLEGEEAFPKSLKKKHVQSLSSQLRLRFPRCSIPPRSI